VRWRQSVSDFTIWDLCLRSLVVGVGCESSPSFGLTVVFKCACDGRARLDLFIQEAFFTFFL